VGRCSFNYSVGCKCDCGSVAVDVKVGLNGSALVCKAMVEMVSMMLDIWELRLFDSNIYDKTTSVACQSGYQQKTIPVGSENFCNRPDRPWGPPSLLYKEKCLSHG
jgi:hypothetical protein